MIIFAVFRFFIVKLQLLLVLSLVLPALVLQHILDTFLLLKPRIHYDSPWAVVLGLGVLGSEQFFGQLVRFLTRARNDIHVEWRDGWLSRTAIDCVGRGPALRIVQLLIDGVNFHRCRIDLNEWRLASDSLLLRRWLDFATISI